MPHLNILTVILKMKHHIFIIGDWWMLGGDAYTHMHMHGPILPSQHKK